MSVAWHGQKRPEVGKGAAVALVSTAEVVLVPVVAKVSDLPGCLSPPLFFTPHLLQNQFLFSFSILVYVNRLFGQIRHLSGDFSSIEGSVLGSGFGEK